MNLGVGRKMLLTLLGMCICLTPAGYAQTCVMPQNLCDQWWDSKTSKWIQNPSCAWLSHVYLQSDQVAPNPSDGYVQNLNGTRCGRESNGMPCGVKTATNTCAESTGPIFCDPSYDPSCCGDPYDPSCGLYGGGGDVCDPENPCYYGAPRGNESVEARLRRAIEVSPLPKSVVTLLKELAKTDALYLKAKFTLSFNGTKTTESYEYWERGSQYRIHLDPGRDYSDIAFNGRFFQQRTDVDAVEIRRGDDRTTPLPDGPLALALAPLRVNDPTECLLCQLRLADLKKAAAWRRGTSAKLQAAEAALGAGAFDAGASRTGETDARGRLLRLLWPAEAAGGQGFEVTLSDYQPIAGTEAMFPMRLIARLKPGAFVEYAVEKIDLSPSFGDEVFDIYSMSPKVLFGVIDATGAWSGHYIRYTRTPGLKTSCDTKAQGTPKP